MWCEILSLREHPEMLERFIGAFAAHWGKAEVYRDCMTASLTTSSSLPQWYLSLAEDGGVAGCVGLITNDFVSRMDLWPWLCALFVSECHRGHGLGGFLIEHVSLEAKRLGFTDIYCCTDHVGYYERYGFRYLGTGYHPWDETSRIYGRRL